MNITKEVLAQLFPFKSLSDDSLQKILATAALEVKRFPSGTTVLDRCSGDAALCFVLSGKCEVERQRSSNESMPVKTVGPFESFGIISVFSKKKTYPTTVKTKCESEILFIHKESFLRLVADYPAVSASVIEFLLEKIEYLNDSLSTFCAKSVEGRLARKLLLMGERLGDKIEISMTRLCGEIGIGRASLYRILLEFEKCSLIKTDKKTIIILNPKGLEEII